MPALLVSTFWTSLAFVTFIISSNASFATLYPCSRPKSIPFAIPSLNLSFISVSKSNNATFLPFSYPSLYARLHKFSRFLPSSVVFASLRNFLMSSVVARVIKSKNGSCFVAGAVISVGAGSSIIAGSVVAAFADFD